MFESPKRRRLALTFVPLLLAAATGRAAEFPVTFETVARDALKPVLHATHAPFPNRNVINGADAGLVGDGRTDNTEALRKLFAIPGQSVAIGPGDFRTGRFVIPADILLTLAPGTIIRDTGNLRPNEPLMQIYGNHVKILGKGARILENRDDYTSGQGRHGVYIIKVSDVSIEGLESSDSGGDGFYIGGPANKPATDVSLIDCVARNNRRQGLSIVNARRIDVVNSTFDGSTGTPPSFGVDLEPNFKTDVLSAISLVGVRTAGNEGGGIAIYLNPLNPGSQPVDINILDHISSNEPTAFVTSTAAQSVTGVIRYVRAR